MTRDTAIASNNNASRIGENPRRYLSREARRGRWCPTRS